MLKVQTDENLDGNVNCVNGWQRLCLRCLARKDTQAVATDKASPF